MISVPWFISPEKDINKSTQQIYKFQMETY